MRLLTRCLADLAVEAAAVLGSVALTIHQETEPPPLLGYCVPVAVGHEDVHVALFVTDGLHVLSTEDTDTTSPVCVPGPHLHLDVACLSLSHPLTCVSLSPYLVGCLLPWLLRLSFFSSAWHFSRLSPLPLCSIWYFFNAACRGQRRHVCQHDQNLLSSQFFKCKKKKNQEVSRWGSGRPAPPSSPALWAAHSERTSAAAHIQTMKHHFKLATK